jgi:type IV secretion system protein VirB10
LKCVGLAGGLLVLGYFTAGEVATGKPRPPQKKKATAQVWPMSPANIDSQQSELDREMEEAKRAAEQAEFANRRAQNTFDPDGPHTAQVNPVSQLRQQLQLEEIRRAHTAAYASTIAFAPQGGHAEPKAERVSSTPVAAPLPKEGESTPATKPAENQNAQSLNGEPEPGTCRLDEGTLVETVLLNRLDGEFSGPVITQVANDVYSRAGLELLIPKSQGFSVKRGKSMAWINAG